MFGPACPASAQLSTKTLLGSLAEQCFICLSENPALKAIQENILQAGSRQQNLDAGEEPINFYLGLDGDRHHFRVFKRTTPSENGRKLWLWGDFAWQYASTLSRFYAINPFSDTGWRTALEL